MHRVERVHLGGLRAVSCLTQAVNSSWRACASALLGRPCAYKEVVVGRPSDKVVRLDAREKCDEGSAAASAGGREVSIGLVFCSALALWRSLLNQKILAHVIEAIAPEVVF